MKANKHRWSRWSCQHSIEILHPSLQMFTPISGLNVVRGSTRQLDSEFTPWFGRKRKQKGCEICFLWCWKTFIISIFVNALWHIVMLILDLWWSGNICIPCSGFFYRKVGKYIDILGCIWKQLSLLSTKILFRCLYPDVTRFQIWTHPDDRTNVN